ncbi:rRNA processing/ribosome biogenesis-domain-containing protein [Paraphysoderma sedebokerense]|nr:rRNA processing/ribosome biogenesis-domain-containing protein [Paraphysoderma sedebokerense]
MSEHTRILQTILTSFLSDDATVHTNLPFILSSISSSRVLINAKVDQLSAGQASKSNSTVLHKWNVRLNALLQSRVGNARWAAMSLIKETTIQSPETYVQYAASWVGTMQSSLNRPEPTSHHKAAIETLLFLYQQTPKYPEIQKDLTNSSLPKFAYSMINLAGNNNELLPTIFCTLSSLIRQFPTLLRSSMEKAQNLCLSKLDGSVPPNSGSAQKAARCLVDLCLVSSKAGVAEVWRSTCIRALGSIHDVLNEILACADEETKSPQIVSRFEFHLKVDDYARRFPILLNRLYALDLILSECLKMRAPSPVSLPIDNIMKLITRLFNLYEGIAMLESHEKIEYSLLVSQLPSLHNLALSLLNLVVSRFGHNLIKYSRLFSNIIHKQLKDSQQNRIGFYRLIYLLLPILGIPFYQRVESTLIEALIVDLKINKLGALSFSGIPTVDSVVDVMGRKKKKGNRGSKRSSAATSDTVHIGDSVNKAVMRSSLEVVSQLILTHGAVIPISKRLEIDNILVSHILHFQHTLPPSTISHPYTPAIRSLFLKTLLHSVLLPSNVIKNGQQRYSLVSYAVQIFESGMKDRNVDVRNVAREALLILDGVVRPRAPVSERGTKILDIVTPGSLKMNSKRSWSAVESGNEEDTADDDDENEDDNDEDEAATTVQESAKRVRLDSQMDLDAIEDQPPSTQTSTLSGINPSSSPSISTLSQTQAQVTSKPTLLNSGSTLLQSTTSVTVEKPTQAAKNLDHTLAQPRPPPQPQPQPQSRHHITAEMSEPNALNSPQNMTATKPPSTRARTAEETLNILKSVRYSDNESDEDMEFGENGVPLIIDDGPDSEDEDDL